MTLKLYIRDDGVIAHENAAIRNDARWKVYNPDEPIVEKKDTALSDLDFDFATKDQLVEYARTFYSVDLDKRRNLESLRQQVLELVGA